MPPRPWVCPGKWCRSPGPEQVAQPPHQPRRWWAAGRVQCWPQEAGGGQAQAGSPALGYWRVLQDTPRTPSEGDFGCRWMVSAHCLPKHSHTGDWTLCNQKQIFHLYDMFLILLCLHHLHITLDSLLPAIFSLSANCWWSASIVWNPQFYCTFNIWIILYYDKMSIYFMLTQTFTNCMKLIS